MSKKSNKPALPAEAFPPAEARRAGAKAGKPTTAATSTRRPMPKRLLLILLALIVGGFAAWKFWPRGDVGYRPGELHIVEETLTAKNPLLQLLSADETGIDFQNQIKETKANNFATNINVYNGGGVAIADVNNDNLPDVYFVCSNGQNRLYLNEGNFKFKDITKSAGLTSE
ncbi:MAG: VCBS repeat-containing protein, partial [Phycisphaerae bacterium]|nr:VCBS repeat-containing protein [Saprospiraceae bacterium]